MHMNIQFDHFVHFVDDLDSAVEVFRTQGFHVVYGGSHPMWGTYNALIYFDDCYLELIAIEQEQIYEQAAKVPFTLHETYEKLGRRNGICRSALRVQGIEAVAEVFKGTEFEYDEPTHFTRQTKLGTTVGWQLFHIGKREPTGDVPFFIDWEITDEERFAVLREQQVIAPHLAGDLRLAEVHMAVQNCADLKRFYKLIQLPITETDNGFEVVLNNTRWIYLQCAEQASLCTLLKFTGAFEESSFTYHGTTFGLLNR